MKPPDSVIAEAIEAARRSPCAKSKRGVVIFKPDPDDPEDPIEAMIQGGNNAPPAGMHCDGSEACRRDCAKICIHAEENALLHIDRDDWSLFGDRGFHLNHLDLVHVKIVRGVLVPGGPPSCWQCSRTILDAQIGGVWLYQTADSIAKMPIEFVPPGTQFGGPGVTVIMGEGTPPLQTSLPAPQWLRYTAEQFHRATLALTPDGPLHASR